MGNIVYYIWIFLNILLFIYASFESVLLIFSLWKKKKEKMEPLTEFPFVTIQLPLYNEKFVIERLLKSILEIDYPKDKLEIQILDDSTDETSDIIKSNLSIFQNFGITVHHIQRVNRTGFKAGALDFGIKSCKGEFIAIFDADFVPKKEFLKRTLPFFKNPKICTVQTRWTHINEKFSFLTRAQAIMLNTHFAVEHLGRIASGAYINFNGTAGIWRKKSIEDAGGWEADTLTEDLDLSYRAQSKGWRFQYLFDMESPAELPITVDAFKTQQYRWSKGAAECVRKNTILLWKSPSSLWAKIAGTIHLLNSSLYIVVFLLVILSPFVFWLMRNDFVSNNNLGLVTYSNLFITFSIPVMFLAGHLMASKQKWKELLFFPINFYLFLCISISISFYMVIGVIEGYLGKKSEFVRTPKFNLKTTNFSSVISNGYSFKKESNVTIFEGIILLYGILVFVLGCLYGNILIANFGVMISIGYTLKVFFPKKIFRF